MLLDNRDYFKSVVPITSGLFLTTTSKARIKLKRLYTKL